METKDILKQLRKSKGYANMKDFCDEAKISINTYQNYETGKRMPTAEFLMKLADFYNVTTDYLLGREPKADPYLDLNLKKADEDEMLKKYMSLPENVRAMLLKVMKELVGEDGNDSDPEQITDAKGRVRHTALAGDILDEWERQRKANEKDVG